MRKIDKNHKFCKTHLLKAFRGKVGEAQVRMGLGFCDKCKAFTQVFYITDFTPEK